MFELHSTVQILNNLQIAIEKKQPFSLIRFGDGGLKFMKAVQINNIDYLKNAELKESIPVVESKKVVSLWSKYANQANYIDTPAVYFSSNFWPRVKNKKMVPATTRVLEVCMQWESIYQKTKISTARPFCNPDVNFLALVHSSSKKTLLSVLRERKICVISIYPKIDCLEEITSASSFLKINDIYQNQFAKDFVRIIKLIENPDFVSQFDLFLVAAGELGRLYSGIIAQNSGRAFDIGSAVSFFQERKIPSRLEPFLKPHASNPMLLEFTKQSYKYKDFI